ncbi:isoaspartyl peptidase/L-asparaginase [Bremerella sp. JC817]|uniref:isoaspartyl peptidase/L-asparaginase family protein n=1 Tax=Bremerella sp. JC817 TaxID=3231756 RepID=UPI0034589E7D
MHGGAGCLPDNVTPERVLAYRQSLDRILRLAEDLLTAGETALDVAERTVMALEDDTLFNAGKGSVPNQLGYHQLDASIMDGRHLACGAVGAVSTLRNPIRAARLVMEQTRHILLVGKDADDFGRLHQLDQVSQDYYFDPVRWEQFEASQQQLGYPVLKTPPYGMPELPEPPIATGDTDISRGTVGCVVLDSSGNLASATSTGGTSSKTCGRVGDTGIIGGGTYADNRGCAISCTGHGEQFMRHSIAFQVNWRVSRQNESLQDVVVDCIDNVLQPGGGGIIAVDHQGNLALEMNTKSMHRAWADSTGQRGVAVYRDEKR